MKTTFLFSTGLAVLTLAGCKSDDDSASREVYHETVIYRETMAPSVRSQGESFSSSGAVGTSAGVTNDLATRALSDRIIIEGAGANRAERGSSVNPTEAGDRLYRDTSVQGQILIEGAGAQRPDLDATRPQQRALDPTRPAPVLDPTRSSTADPTGGQPNRPLAPNRIRDQAAPPPVPGSASPSPISPAPIGK